MHIIVSFLTPDLDINRSLVIGGYKHYDGLPVAMGTPGTHLPPWLSSRVGSGLLFSVEIGSATQNGPRAGCDWHYRRASPGHQGAQGPLPKARPSCERSP